MAVTSNACSEGNDLTTIFPIPTENGDQKYRFFTLPIEQIPGFDNTKPQILVHRPDNGLQWYSLDLCMPVVTCLKMESEELVAERRNILVFKDFDADPCPVPLTDCPTEDGGGTGE